MGGVTPGHGPEFRRRAEAVVPGHVPEFRRSPCLQPTPPCSAFSSPRPPPGKASVDQTSVGACYEFSSMNQPSQSQREPGHPASLQTSSFFGEEAHPFLRHNVVPKEAVGEATLALSLWVNAWEKYSLSLADVPQAKWKPFMGRGQPLKFRLVSLFNDRSGPLPQVKVPPDVPQAYRAALTYQKVFEGVLTAPKSPKWKKAITQLLASSHASSDAFRASLAPETIHRIRLDAIKLHKFAKGFLPHPPLTHYSAYRRQSPKSDTKRKSITRTGGPHGMTIFSRIMARRPINGQIKTTRFQPQLT